MLGAIIGDIVGSRFEWDNIKSKEFTFFDPVCHPTDDSVMTLSVARAVLACDGDYSSLSDQAVICMQELGRRYPDAGYGGRFGRWLCSTNPEPYSSFGNGSAMRISPCVYVADTMEDAIALAKTVTEVTHNHPEGIKGAEATTAAIFMALHGSSKKEIRTAIEKNYYKLDFTLDQIRPTYKFDVTCQGSVPQAIEAFLESSDFEDAIRNAISIGGDGDTIAAITGSIAEAYYGIPENIRGRAIQYLDKVHIDILNNFEAKYGIVQGKGTQMDTVLNTDRST